MLNFVNINPAKFRKVDKELKVFNASRLKSTKF